MSDKYGPKYSQTLIGNLDVAVNKIHHYFEDMESGIVDPAGEIIFDGSSYVMASEEWFKRFFEWNGNEWELK